MMTEDKHFDPEKEGHQVEWQDRARVVIDPQKNLEKEASPRQSPLPDEDVEEKSPQLEKKKENSSANRTDNSGAVEKAGPHEAGNNRVESEPAY